MLSGSPNNSNDSVSSVPLPRPNTSECGGTEFIDLNPNLHKNRCDSIADDPEKKRLLNSKMTMEIRFSKYRKALTKRNVFVDILAILFGIGSWIGVNSIYVQLPLLVNAAPEGWSLPSYLVIIIQLGNIGPLVYTLLQKFFSKILHDAYWIYAVFLIGSIAAILLAIFYDKTIYLFGSQRSIALLTLSFFLALIGCTSSVLFMPYMGRFKAIYLITYLIGEGLSGFLPSIIALIQGVGGNAECIEVQGANGTEIVSHTPPALFNTKVFFILVFITIIVSSIAFVLLNKLDLCKREYTEVIISKGNIYDYNKTNNPGDDEIPETKSEQKKYLSTFNYYFIIVLMIVVSMLGNGFFPSIQSYACLPYGNVAYHFTVTLSAIANPVACFLAVFLHHTSIRTMISLALVGAVLSCYVLAISLLSPTPPLMGQVSGEILIILSFTLLMGIISYVKLSMTAVFRSQGGKSLVIIGAVSQLGSFIGAIISFALVNYTNLFTTYQPC